MTTNKYQLWLETNGGKSKLQLPVNPEQITIKDSANSESISVGGLGDVIIPNGMKAAQISFSSIFPSHYFSGCAVENLMASYIYVMAIEGFVKYGSVLKFRLTGRNITKNVIIDSFQYSEKGGDVGTYEYSLTLKEYRSVKPRQIEISKINGKASVQKNTTTRVSTKETPKTYTVKQGDCLWNIAKKYYGSGSLYTKIYNANKKIIGSNPNLIYPGQVLTIP